MNLLTYGTLRPGSAETVTLFGYRMFDMGWYPAIIKGNPEDKVVCERVPIKDADHLQSLDAYEGYNEKFPSQSLYTREMIGNDYIYIYNRDIDKGSKTEVVNGDWLAYKQAGAGSNSQLMGVHN